MLLFIEIADSNNNENNNAWIVGVSAAVTFIALLLFVVIFLGICSRKPSIPHYVSSKYNVAKQAIYIKVFLFFILFHRYYIYFLLTIFNKRHKGRTPCEEYQTNKYGIFPDNSSYSPGVRSLTCFTSFDLWLYCRYTKYLQLQAAIIMHN